MVILKYLNEFTCRFKTLKEAEIYYKKQELQSQGNCCGTLINPTKSSSMQTEIVNLFILLDMLDLIPEECRLPALFEIF